MSYLKEIPITMSKEQLANYHRLLEMYSNSMRDLQKELIKAHYHILGIDLEKEEPELYKSLEGE